MRTHVHQRLGRAYLQNGRGGEAERLLLTAVTDVEQSRATLDEDRFRIAFLTDKADAFDDLVQLYLQRSLHTSEATHRRSALKAAFAIAERAKSRALLDMMTNLAVPGAAPELPQSDESFGRVTFHLDEVRAQLDAKTILLYYYICGDEISAFVISKHTATNETIECVHALSKLSVVRPLLEALSVQWERFLAGPEFVARYAQQMEATGQRILFRLYQELVKPVEAHIHARTTQAGETPLVIMAHGPLHQVPFHALHDGTDYLVERYDISYAPSATTFLLSQQRKALGMDKSLVVGTDDASIPMALVEAQQVAQQLARSNAKPNSQVVLRVGAQATLQQVQADMAGCDIIHLACHGLFRHDNPLFSSVQLHDGKLTAADAARLRFNGALITLGACESGRSQVIAGDEMLGLPRAFLGAGASSVLVSLWLVNDAITAEFMTGWYKQIQQGVPRAQALRAMQRSIKRHHAHPYYWAPFILIGQR